MHHERSDTESLFPVFGYFSYLTVSNGYLLDKKVRTRVRTKKTKNGPNFLRVRATTSDKKLDSYLDSNMSLTFLGKHIIFWTESCGTSCSHFGLQLFRRVNVPVH